MMKNIVAYVPVLHKGYFDFFSKHAPQADYLFVVGRELIAEVDHLRKDLRALEPEQAVQGIRGWGIFKGYVALLDHAAIEALASNRAPLVMPNEEISRHIGGKYFSGNDIEYDSVFFLRWDPEKVLAQRPPGCTHRTSAEDFDREVMRSAFREAELSSDWWRHVGAILLRDKEPIFVAHNRHLPSEHTPYIVGDPRSNFKKGLNIELSTAAHAEVQIIGEAARRGISTEGCSLYVTTFPCPPCAKLVALSGIKTLYYSTGYAMLDGEEDLRRHGVEIVYVEMESPPQANV